MLDTNMYLVANKKYFMNRSFIIYYLFPILFACIVNCVAGVLLFPLACIVNYMVKSWRLFQCILEATLERSNVRTELERWRLYSC